MNPQHETIVAGLLDDPTFTLMTPAERREEVSALLTSAGEDPDPLAVALILEEAESRERPAPVAAQLPLGIEACREDRPACRSPVAANGRCLECGARRVSPEDALVIAPAVEAAKRQKEDRALLDVAPEIRPVEPPRAPKPRPRPPEPRKASTGFLSRFAAATGTNDRDIGDLLGLARSTIQGVRGGRIPEALAPSQCQALTKALRSQLDQLQGLLAEIEDRTS